MTMTLTLVVFLRNIIDVAVTSAGLKRRVVHDAPIKRSLLAHVQQIWGFKTDWAQFLVDNCMPGHPDALEQLKQMHNELLEESQRFKMSSETISLENKDTDAFYQLMLASLDKLAEVSSRCYKTGLTIFAKLIESDLVQASQNLSLLEKATDRVELVKAFDPATNSWARLIESVSFVSLQTSTPPDISESMKIQTTALDDLNNSVAEHINELVITTVGSEEERISQEGLSAVFAAIDLLLRDMKSTAAEYSALVNSLNLFLEYKTQMDKANDYAKNLDDIIQSELEHIKSHGATAMLDEFTKKTGKKPSAAMSALAESTDVIDSAVENILFALAGEESIGDLKDAVETASPALSGLPKSLTSVILEETQEIQAVSTASSVFAAEQSVRLTAVAKALDEALTKNTFTQDEAFTNNLQIYHEILNECIRLFSLDTNVHVFDSEQVAAFREDAKNRLNATASENVSPARVKWLSSECQSLSNKLIQLKTEHIDLSYEFNKKLAEQLSQELASSVNTANATLVSAASELMAKGFGDGRQQQMMTVCGDVSNITDVSRVIMPLAPEDSPWSKPEAPPPSQLDLDELPVLDSVKKLFGTSNKTSASTAMKTSLTALFKAKKYASPAPTEALISASSMLASSVASTILTSSLASLHESPEGSPVMQRSPSVRKGTAASLVERIQALATKDEKQPSITIPTSSRLSRPKSVDGSSISDSLAAPLTPVTPVATELVDSDDETTVLATSSVWSEQGTLESERLSNGNTSVVAGSVNQLFIYLTSAAGSGEDGSSSTDFVRTFIVTYHTFANPAEFLAKLIERYNVPALPPGSDKNAYELGVRYPTQVRVCNIIKRWLLTRSEQDLPFNNVVQTRLLQFIEGPIATNSSYLANNIKKCLETCIIDEKFQFQKRLSEGYSPIDTTFIKSTPTDRETPFYRLLRQFSPRDVAAQFTLIDAELLRAIRLRELLNQRWTGERAAFRAKNILRWIEHTARLSTWVSACVVREETVRARAKVFTKFVELANELRQLGNFHTCMAVVAGLSSAAVTRLKWTIRELSSRTSKLQAELEKEIESFNSYATYRESYEKAPFPKIPFLGVLLNDIATIENDFPAKIDGRVSWTRCQELLTPLASFLEAQHRAVFDSKENKSMQRLLLESIDQLFALPSALYDLSLQREPFNGVPKDKAHRPSLTETVSRLREKLVKAL